MGRRVSGRSMVVGVVALAVILTLVYLPSGCSSPAPLRVGTLRVMDSLPLSLALHKPIFAENNLAVEVVYFDEPSWLRAALTAGAVDAAVTDLCGAILLSQGETGGKIVRVALRAYPGRPMFALVAAAHASIPLENARIAVSGEASHQYVAEKLLSAAGIARWTGIEVAGPERALEMLRIGEVAVALLPGPFVSLAVLRGDRVVVDDAGTAAGESVVIFNQRTVDRKPAIIRRFLRAYEQSARELNIRGERYRSLVVDLLPIPSEVSTILPIPLFPFPGEVPTESEVESAGDWLREKKIASQPVSYRQTVTAGFLWDPYQFRPAACCGW